MRALIYAHRSKTEEAEAMAVALRQECKTILFRDTRGFNGDIETCDRVYTDNPEVATAYEARGIEVKPYTPKQALAAGGGDPEPTEGADDPGSNSGAKRPRRARKRK